MADENKPVRVNTKEDFDREMAELQLKRAQLENRRLEREVQHLEMQDNAREASSKSKARTLEDNKQKGEQKIAGCNHKKGGKGLEGFRGRGQSQYYAIIQHMFPNGDIGIMCQRCPKIWLPPVVVKRDDWDNKAEYELAKKAYDKDLAEYRWALNLPTDNEMSTSGLFTGAGFQENCREALHAAAAVPQDV